MTLRASEMSGLTHRYVASPVEGEDYISHIEVEPVQEIYEISVGLTKVKSREIGGEIELNYPCRRRVVEVAFTTKAIRKVTFYFGTLVSCSLWRETCNGTSGNVCANQLR